MNVKTISSVFSIMLGVAIPFYAYAVTTAKPVTSSLPAQAGHKLSTAVWIPYWKMDDGVLEVVDHLDVVNEISPFAYEVNSDGTIKDTLKDVAEPLSYLYDQIKGKKISIIPSILWTDRKEMETILNNPKRRAAHIKYIMRQIKQDKVDGIDIDYENKSAETRKGFSAFLTELKVELTKTKKKLVCTVEARTPVESKYRTVTKSILDNIEYANDYKVIGKVCDEVRIMTYDQQGGDIKLSDENAQALYRPVSDIDWVEKVLTLTLFDIPAKKIFVGVPTYGYKYEVIPAMGTSTLTYSRVGSMNFKYADELAKSLNITPSRKGGEAYFSYSTTTDIYGKPLLERTQYLVWYSDAQAIADKVRLAKLYKLGGVAVFKVDGSNDPALWKVLK